LGPLAEEKAHHVTDYEMEISNNYRNAMRKKELVIEYPNSGKLSFISSIVKSILRSRGCCGQVVMASR